MPEKVFKSRRGLALIIPKEIAERYHLEPGVELEVIPVEEGIFLEPKDVAPWFSIEWERALDEVVERYGRAFRMMQDAAPAEGPGGASASP